MQCYNCKVHWSIISVICNIGFSLWTLSEPTHLKTVHCKWKKSFKTKSKSPKPKKMGLREQLALLASSRVGIKPICPSRCKVSSHDMGKDTVTAIMMKKGAIPVRCKRCKNRPVLLTSPGFQPFTIHSQEGTNRLQYLRKALSMWGALHTWLSGNVTHNSISQQL